MTTKEAVDHLTEQLNKDSSYRYSWQANIAVQFQDAWQRAVNNGGLPHTSEQIHEVSNEAAKAFLCCLCGRPDETK